MFRTGFLSVIRTLVLYTQQQVYVIQYWTPDDGQKTRSKNVEFYSKNKFEKLVHLVGFIKRINPKHAAVHALKHYCNSNGVCASVGHTVTF